MIRFAPANRLLILFGLTSAAAVGLGIWTCRKWTGDFAGAHFEVIAWTVGALLALGLSRAGAIARSPAIPAIAVLALAATFLGAGYDGVHRWLEIGPVALHGAFFVLPAAIVALAVGAGGWLTLIAGLAILAILVGQPDASQAIAFAAAYVVIIARAPARLPIRLGVILVAVALAVGSLFRPDPLAGLAMVEGILRLAWTFTPLLAIAGGLAVFVSALAPVLVDRSLPALALSLYAVLVAAAPLVLEVPVPLMGQGAGPIVGLWLGVGLLAAHLRRRDLA